MRRTITAAVAIVLLLSFGTLLRGGLPTCTTGTWTPAGTISSGRSGAASVLLADGRVLISGGLDENGTPLATAEFFTKDGIFIATQSMSVPRSGHAAISLPSGEVLVTGGNTSGGGVTNSGEVFDPTTDTWRTLSAPMVEARSRHTMAQINDETVVVVGGDGGSGPVSGIEFFDVSSGRFAYVASLATPREDAAVAALPNGRVLIAGGIGTVGGSAVPLASTEIFTYNAELGAGAVAAGPNMAVARASATATTTYDGVAIVGGNDGNSDLGTAEIFSQWTNVFRTVSGGAPRSKGLAILLPHNGSVLITGGTAGAAVDLLQPWANNKAGTFITALASATDHSSGFVSATGLEGLALAAGGTGGNSAELYRFPTIFTDKDDYAPGTTVVMTGTGFQPGEKVNLHLHEWVNQTMTDYPDYVVTADPEGGFVFSDYAPTPADVNSRYHLTAVGQSSGLQAQNIFTDKIQTDLALVLSKSFITPGTSSIALTAALTVHNGNPIGGQTIAITRTPGQTSICSPTTNASGVASCNFDTSALSVAQSPYTIKANFNGDSNFQQGNDQQTLYVDGTAPNTSITSNPSNPSNTTSATFSFSGTDNLSTGNLLTFECKLDADSFSACTSPKSYLSLTDGIHTFQVRAIDQAGNVDPTPATYSWTISTDSTAPTTTATPTGTSGANGWYTSDVQVSLSATDNVGGSGVKEIHYSLDGAAHITTANPVAVQVTGDASHSLTYYAVDNAGNTESTHSLQINIDKTPPTGVQVNVSTGTQGAEGWYTSDVTVHTSGTDSVSGPVTCTADQYQATDTSGVAFNGSCANQAGLKTDAASLTIKLDKSTPTATLSITAGTAGAHGWYTSDVTVHTTGTFSASGGTCSADQSQTTETVGVVFNGSCTSGAGLTGNAAPLPVKLDKTGPTATLAVTSGDVGNSGWYTSSVKVATSGTDSISSPVTCTDSQTFSTDTASQSVNGSCTNDAGLKTDAAAITLRIDQTAPTVSVTPSRPVDHNDWYNHPVLITPQGQDSTSGVASCDTAKTYSTPDSASATVNLTCTDNAGNVGQGSFNLKYDATPPSNVTVSAERSPDVDDWYNHAFTATWSGTDTVSNIDTCTTTNYTGPDNATGTLSGTCTDRAGNTSSPGTFAFKYDGTTPTATLSVTAGTAGAHGWYTSDVTAHTAGTFSVSGGTCTADQSQATETVGAVFNGSCTSGAGLIGNAMPLTVKLDKTGPTANVAVSTGQLGTNGWYVSEVTLTTTGSDSISSPVTCTGLQTLSSDTTGQDVGGSCTNDAGLKTDATAINIKIDQTAPTVSVTPSRPADHNDWYNQAVQLTPNGQDATSHVAGCDEPVTYTTPDSATATVKLTCTDNAGNVGDGTFNFKYDATAPTGVSGAPNRTPDHNDWYNKAVGVEFTGNDGVSQIESCSKVNYSGPDSTSASVQGICTDKAGNASSPVSSSSFKYDGTAPSGVTLAVSAGTLGANGWYISPATVHTEASFSISGGSCTPDSSQTTDTKGTTFEGSCTSGAGLNTSAVPLVVKVDTTPPTANLGVTGGTQGNNGWYVSNVTVSTTGTDDISDPVICTDPQLLSSDTSGQSVNGSCTNDAGLKTAAVPIAVKLDKTPPTVAITPDRVADHSGWYNHQVTFTNPGIDSTSGIAGCTVPAAYTGPDTATASVPATCTDNAGNAGNGSFSFKYDATAPSLTCNPAPSFLLGQPSASLSASVTDATSGPVASPVSGNAPTAAVGSSQSVALTGYDAAGNYRTQSCSYTVNYKLIALLQPWGPPGSVAFKRGSTIPLKWQYANYAGVPVNSYNSNSALNPAIGIAGGCSGTPTAVVDTIEDAGKSGLQYDPVTYTWQYNWQTKGVNGTCFWMGIQSGLTGQLDVTGLLPGAVTPQNLWVQLR